MSKLVDHRSVASSKSELDLFSVPPSQVVVERGFWDEIQLANSCTDEGPYDFRIAPDRTMLHINNNFVYVKLKIVHADGTDLLGHGAPDAVDYDNVGPINLLGKTFFSNVKLKIGGKVISDSNDLYTYRAFLETELNYGTDAKNSHLQAALYHRDDDNAAELPGNSGFTARSRYFRNSREVELMAPIHCDLFDQERYLLSMMDLQLELTRAKDPFLLMTPGVAVPNNFRIKVIAMRWYVRKVEVSSEFFMAIEGALVRSPALYPVRRVQMTTIHVGQGRRATPTTALFTGQLPRRVLITCVNSDAFHGRYQLNPFNFQHYNITSAKVIAGGYTFPEPAYSFNIPNGEYMRAYLGLQDALGIEDSNRGNCISRAGFTRGHFVLGFDMTPDSDDGQHWEKLKEGSFSVHLEFANQIPDPGIEVIVYTEYDSLITIDRHRMPSADYALG